MKKSLFITIAFILIGLISGVILILQFKANPVARGTYPLEQIEIQKILLTDYSLEQEELKKQITDAENKLQEAQLIIEQRSSPENLKSLDFLRFLAGLNEVQGSGIRIIFDDNPAVSRNNFSIINDDFVQASDIRDVVNNLFLQDASAIAINGKRILPLSAIQPVADNLLVGNYYLSSPFVIEAIGDSQALLSAVAIPNNRGIKIYIDEIQNIKIGPVETSRSIQYLNLQSKAVGN